MIEEKTASANCSEDEVWCPPGMSASAFKNEIIERVLGRDWYCEDPMGPTQVNLYAMEYIRVILENPIVRAAMWLARRL